MAEKLIYTANVKTTGGRDGGKSTSSDGNLEVALSMPKEFGGPGGVGTNPEQLFAAAYSSCFLSAMKLVARLEKITLPEASNVTGSVGVLSTDAGFKLTVELAISMPGLEKDMGDKVIAGAHERCPFSNAVKRNVEVSLTQV